MVRQSYELGRGTLLDVIAEQRRYIEIEMGYTEALKQVYDAAVEIERAVGAAEPLSEDGRWTVETTGAIEAPARALGQRGSGAGSSRLLALAAVLGVAARWSGGAHPGIAMLGPGARRAPAVAASRDRVASPARFPGGAASRRAAGGRGGAC